MMGLWVFYVCFSYSISAVYTSANFINVCVCVCDYPSIVFLHTQRAMRRKKSVAK